MGLLAHTLVEMSDSIPREISIELSTKEMRLGMVLGEFYKNEIHGGCHLVGKRL